MPKGLAGAVGAALGLAIVLLQFGLFVAGVSYRKDCVNADGPITKSWTFTWFAPIPYLFRPEDPNCVIHTGTRVALNSVGIARFGETTSSKVAQQAVERANPNSEDAYWLKLRGALNDYFDRYKRVADIAGAQHSVETLHAQLTQLTPPSRYEAARGNLISAIEVVQRDGRKLAEAAQAGDQEAYKRLRARVEPDALKVQDAMERLNDVHG